MSIIEIKDVDHFYGTGSARFHALHAINFAADAGTLNVISGPSGSGKSTFLAIMGGVLTPTSGMVTINDKRYDQMGQKQRDALRLDEIGFVLQSYKLLPYLTVADQFKFVEKVRPEGNVSQVENKEILETLGISSLLNKYPGELSGGQQQRVAIARALYTDPAIILADEPTAALDSSRVTEVGTLLKNLALKYNKAVIVVTHDLRLTDFADHLYEIEDGRLTQKS
ncbi:ABC transporter ATP-binding protein [Weissella thailandensis]|uniref:Putative hemin import ATP-binding protein HrtA n=1 Tax=Weissella thailandensis TaxID=89061 RepID=A0ABX9I267_9LACO|nr:ABC transporter ATP-binding protein [Weissella thailandensis]NKY90254.1 ABC transporter ATP-binding protein [Weissella thailandensis]RDS58697.1 ABC transporter ATP-binding protein [Weissella thailandensis]GEP75561.1 ABC transporter ATP-binding protein [Weissella thailandensis]